MESSGVCLVSENTANSERTSPHNGLEDLGLNISTLKRHDEEKHHLVEPWYFQHIIEILKMLSRQSVFIDSSSQDFLSQEQRAIHLVLWQGARKRGGALRCLLLLWQMIWHFIYNSFSYSTTREKENFHSSDEQSPGEIWSSLSLVGTIFCKKISLA